MPWTVYIILASDGSLYTGITTDLERRFAEHQGEPGKGKSRKGAKYFHRGRYPQAVVYREASINRSSASQREAAIKKLSRNEKLSLCDNFDCKQNSQDSNG